MSGVLFDDPRSEFNGVRRQVDINENSIDNEGGPEYWYTDPFGRRAQPNSFPGAIRQVVAKVNTNRGSLGTSGPVLGGDRNARTELGANGRLQRRYVARGSRS